MAKKIAVIGGGIAGLVAAFRLKQHGFAVTLLEAAETLGGKIQTRHLAQGCLDVGPNTVLESNEAIMRLISDLGLRKKILWADDSSASRFILKDGNLVELPAKPQQMLLSPILSLSAKLRVFLDFFIPPAAPDETVAAFIERRFGREPLEYLVNPFLAGTYAARPDDLSVSATLKQLKTFEREHGSVLKGAFKQMKAAKTEPKKKFSRKMFSFSGGFYDVVQALGQALHDDVLLSAEVVRVIRHPRSWEVCYVQAGKEKSLRASVVIFATPAPETSRLVKSLAPDVSKALAEIPYSPVAQLFFVYDKLRVPSPKGFGFLVPEAENRDILGAVFNSSIFPTRYEDTVFTVFVGGSRQPELLKLSDDDLRALSLIELNATLNLHDAPTAFALERWAQAIPQYGLAHQKILDAVAALEMETEDLFFCGNWRGGISVPDTIAQADETVQKIIATLDNRD